MHILFWGVLAASCMGEKTVRVLKNQKSMKTFIVCTH